MLKGTAEDHKIQMTAMSSGQGVWDLLEGLFSGRFAEGPSVWQRLCFVCFSPDQAGCRGFAQ